MISMIRLLLKSDDLLAAFEKGLLTLFTGALALILMSQVGLRYVFSRPLFWAEEISVQLLVFITLIGLSLLLKEKRMIAIDFIVASLPDTYRKVISIFLQFLGLVVVLLFAYQGTLWIMRPEVRLELSPTTQLPVWINYAVFPLAFCGMTIHLVIGLISSLISFKSGRGKC